MKKLTLIAAFAILATQAWAKEVATCSSFLAGATAELECSGDFEGKTTMVNLYKKGWRYVGDISGARNFILVFEK